MMSIREMAVWLGRIGHCRGFGVQSPSAYAFIRYVVSEHYPYYAYDDLRRAMPRISHLHEKVCRLYLRLANKAQAGHWIFVGSPTEHQRAYIAAGCRRTVIDCCGAADVGDVLRRCGPHAVVVVRHGMASEAVVEAVCGVASADTLLVIDGIVRDPAARMAWRRLAADSRASVLFDLYYCGIAFFDSRHKAEYKVNF